MLINRCLFTTDSRLYSLLQNGGSRDALEWFCFFKPYWYIQGWRRIWVHGDAVLLILAWGTVEKAMGFGSLEVLCTVKTFKNPAHSCCDCCVGDMYNPLLLTADVEFVGWLVGCFFQTVEIYRRRNLPCIWNAADEGERSWGESRLSELQWNPLGTCEKGGAFLTSAQ